MGGFVAGLAIYQRLKEPRGNSHVWRYRRIQEARGVKTASIHGPFYIRPTQSNGAQPWVALDAATFDQAKLERDKKARGQSLLAENGAGRVLIADAIASFLELKKRKNQSTVENYTFILNEFLQQTSAKYIDQVDRRVLDAYVTWLEETKNAAPKTINNKVMVVVFMLKDAGVANPYKIVKDLLPTVEEEVAEPYSEKDLKKLFAEMNEDETCRYTFFLMTACRENEVAHARWTDVVLKGYVPHFVVQAKKFKYSDGSAGEFTPKSHERREIPITKELVDMLQKCKQESTSEWIFPNEQGDPEGHFLRKFKKIAFRAGLNCGKCTSTRSEGRFTKVKVEKNCATYSEGCSLHYLHRLRKTRATFWHTHDITLRTIQAYLGHSDLKTTQKYLGVQDATEVESTINKPMF
jgi:integrase/recombinase XerD